ncbi:MAG: tryptophan-rich sensory protein [Clostridia bacterium]|nr:tryptophan-rich sensory protein [Clostridia bacterium]
MKKAGKLILSVLITEVPGFLSGAAAISAEGLYESLALPAFAPPPAVFRVVWPTLYLLMGIVLYRLRFLLPEREDSEALSEANNFFMVQLAISYLWTPIFFILNNFWAAFFWIVLLFFTAGAAFLKTKKADRISSYLYVPYLLWIIFAAVLNFSAAVMN